MSRKKKTTEQTKQPVYSSIKQKALKEANSIRGTQSGNSGVMLNVYDRQNRGTIRGTAYDIVAQRRKAAEERQQRLEKLQSWEAEKRNTANSAMRNVTLTNRAGTMGNLRTVTGDKILQQAAHTGAQGKNAAAYQPVKANANGLPDYTGQLVQKRKQEEADLQKWDNFLRTETGTKQATATAAPATTATPQTRNNYNADKLLKNIQATATPVPTATPQPTATPAPAANVAKAQNIKPEQTERTDVLPTATPTPTPASIAQSEPDMSSLIAQENAEKETKAAAARAISPVQMEKIQAKNAEQAGYIAAGKGPRATQEQTLGNYLNYIGEKQQLGYGAYKKQQGVDRASVTWSGQEGMPTIEDSKKYFATKRKFNAYDATDEVNLWSEEYRKQVLDMFPAMVEEQEKEAKAALREYEEGRPRAKAGELFDFIDAWDENNENSILNGNYNSEYKNVAQNTLADLLETRETRKEYALAKADDYLYFDFTQDAYEEDQQKVRESVYNSIMPDTYAERTEVMNARDVAQLNVILDDLIEKAKTGDEASLEDAREKYTTAMNTAEAYRGIVKKAEAAEKESDALKNIEGWFTDIVNDGTYNPKWVPEPKMLFDDRLDRYVPEPQGTDFQKTLWWANNWQEALGDAASLPDFVRPEMFLDDDQLKKLNQLASIQGSNAAELYYNHLKPQLEQMAADHTQMYFEAISETPVVGEAVRIFSPALNAVGGMASLVGTALALLGNKNAGKKTSAWYAANNLVTTVRQHQNDVIGNWFAENYGDNAGAVAKFFLNVGDSVADNLFAMGTANALTGGNVASNAGKAMIQLIMSGEATGNTMLTKLSQGMDPTEAALYALGDGVIEWLTEDYSLEVLLRPDVRGMIGNGRKLAGYLFKATLAEGSEEGAADLANMALDGIISTFAGHETELMNRYNAELRALLLQNPGMDRAEAQKQATRKVLTEKLGEIGLSMLAGAISGFALAGGRTVSNAVQVRNEGGYLKNSGRINELIAMGLQTKKGSEGRALAERLQQKLENGETITNKEAGMLKANLQMDAGESMDKRLSMGLDNYTEDLGTLRSIAEITGDTIRGADSRTGMKLATKEEMDDAATRGKKVTGPLGVVVNSEDGRKFGKIVDIQQVKVKQEGETEEKPVLKFRVNIDGKTVEVDPENVLSTHYAGAVLLHSMEENPGLYTPEFTNILIDEMNKEGPESGRVLAPAAESIRLAAMTGAEMPKTGIAQDVAERLYNETLREESDRRASELKTANMKAAGTGRVMYKGLEYGTDAYKAAVRTQSRETRNVMGAAAEIARRAGVDLWLMDNEDLEKERQSGRLKFNRELSKLYGYEVSTREKDGKNGIVINIEGKNSNGEKHNVLVTFGHEFTHWLQRNSLKAYDQLQKETLDMQRKALGGQVKLNERLMQIMDNQGVDLHTAIGELVADSYDQIFSSEKVIRNIQEQNPTLYTQMKGFVKDLVARIGNAISGMSGSISRDAQQVWYKNMNRMAELFNLTYNEATGQVTEAQPAQAEAATETVTAEYVGTGEARTVQARITNPLTMKQGQFSWMPNQTAQALLDSKAISLTEEQRDALRKVAEHAYADYAEAWDQIADVLQEQGYDGIRMADGQYIALKNTQTTEEGETRLSQADSTEWKLVSESDGQYYEVDQKTGKRTKLTGDEAEYVAAWKRGDFRTMEDILARKIRENGAIPFKTPNSYSTPNHRWVANAIKQGNMTAIRQAAAEMATMVPDNAVLVPMPNHYGEVNADTDTMILAQEISRITGRPVVIALKGVERQSRQMDKGKPKSKQMQAEDLGFRQVAEIQEGMVPYFVDNVIASGLTAEAAHKALGNNGVTLAYAKSTRSANDGLKRANATFYDTNKQYGSYLIPLSERINMEKTGYEGVRFSEAVNDDDENRRIKAQVNRNIESIMKMEPVADITSDIDLEKYYQQGAKSKFAAIKMWMNDFAESFGREVERKGFGTVTFGKKAITKGSSYLFDDKQLAAFKAVPDVIQNGIEINYHQNHKNRQNNTYTFASPVMFDGEKKVVAVVVSNYDNKNRYKTHKVFMPDGSVFEFKDEKTEVANHPEEPNSLRVHTPVSDNSIAETEEKGKKRNSIAVLEDEYEQAVEEGDTEKQQTLVRAAAEKAMPESKIRDENGDLMVVYHGTEEDFTVFDRTKGRSTMDIQGMFFSPWELDAEGYGRKVGKYYLNITNPASEQTAYAALRRFQGQNEAGVKARDYLISQGYDGVTYDGYEYIAFSPEQIKSADDVTYDDNGKMIPLSERFNPRKTDIRYSQAAVEDATDPKQEELYNAREEANAKVKALRERVRAMKPEVDAWTERITEAFDNGTFDQIQEEYKEWEKGYVQLREELTEAERAYRQANQDFEDYIEQRDVAQEKAEIEKSGLTEAEYRRKQAVKTFGTTSDFNEAGYLMPDGKMLDFSGKKNGAPRGSRTEDHRGIGQIYASSQKQGGEAMLSFMRDGNIRVIGEMPAVDIMSTIEPTAEQYDQIRRMARRFAAGEYFSVDFTDENGNTVDTLEYDGRVNPERIVNDIKTFYRTGAAPEQSVVSQFHFSQADMNDIDVETWMETRTPGSFRTEDERIMWQTWKRLRNDVRMVNFRIEEYKKQIRALEAKGENLTAEERDQLRGLRNKLEVKQVQLDRLEKELRKTTGTEGFATMMREANLVIGDFMAGKTSEQVTAAVDTMTSAVERADKEMAQQQKALEKLGQESAVKTVRAALRSRGLMTAVNALRTQYSTTMSRDELEGRMAEIILKSLKGEDVTADIEALANDVVSRQPGYASVEAEEALSALRGRTIVIGPGQQAELKANHLTLKDLWARTKGSGIKFVFGERSTLDTDAEELIAEVPALRGMLDNEKASLENFVGYVENLLSLKNGTAEESGYDVKEVEAFIGAMAMNMLNENVGGMSKADLIAKIKAEAGRIGTALNAVRRIRESLGTVRESGAKAQTWTGVLGQDLNQVLDYYDQVARMAARQERTQVRKTLVEQLKAENTKKLMQQQEKYEQMMKNDRTARQLANDNMTLRSKINTVVKRISRLMTEETDLKNIPEEAKPLARLLVKMFVEHDSNYRRVTFSDNKQLQRAAENIRGWEKLFGGFDYDHGLDWLVTGEGDTADTELRDAVEEALVDIETGLVEYRNAEGRGTVSLQDRKNALTKIQDAVAKIYNVIQARRYAEIDGKRALTAELAASARDDMQHSRFRGEWTGWLGRRIGTARRGVIYGNMTPVYFFKNLRNGTLSSLFRGYESAENKNGLAIARAQAMMQKIAQETGYGTWDQERRYEIQLEKGGTVRLTLGEMMSLYATWQRELMNQSEINGPEKSFHLTLGGFVTEPEQRGGIAGREIQQQRPHRVTENDIAKIRSLMTPQQLEYVHRVVEYMTKEIGELGNEASMKMFGIKKFNEKWYFPFEVWRGVMNKKSTAGAQNMDKNAAAHPSQAHRRTANAKNALVIRDFTQTAARHIVSQINYNTFAPAIEWMQRVMNTRLSEGADVESMTERNLWAMFQEVYGKDAHAYFTQFQKDMNGGATQQSKTFYDRLISTFRKSAVAGSLSVAAQQPLSYIRAAMEINPRWLVEALNPRYYRGSNAEMEKWSGVAVLKRMGKFDMGFGESAAQYIEPEARQRAGRRVYETASDWTTALPELMDRVTWTRMWTAAKLEQAHLHPEMDQNSDEFMELVANRFNDIIRRTQVYDSTLVRSQNMRDKNPGLKMLTSFMAEPTLTANVLADAIINVREQGGMRRLVTAAATYMLSAVAQAAVKGTMGAGRNPDKKKTWEENWWYRFMYNFISEANPVSLIPGYSDLMTLLKKGELSDDAMGMIGKLMAAVKKTFELPGSEGPWRDVEDSIGVIAQLFSNIPVKNLMRDARAMYNFFTQPYAQRETSQGVLRYQLQDQLFAADNLMGAINIWLGNDGYKSTIDAYALRIYQAQKSGDEEAARLMSEYVTLAKSGAEDPEKALQSKLKSIAKKDKDASAEETMQYLQENGGSEQSVSTYIMDELKDGKIDAEEARKLLKQNEPDKSENDIWWKVDRAEYAKENGTDTPGGYYYRLTDAVESNRAEEINKAVNDLKKHGVTDKQIKTKLSSWKQAYLDATGYEKLRIRDALTKAYKAIGLTAEEAGKIIDGWKEKK